jgi:hypothetical protein
MSINIILPLKLNPIPSRIQSSTPPSLTSSSNLLWILELGGAGGGCFLLKHAHGFALHPRLFHHLSFQGFKEPTDSRLPGQSGPVPALFSRHLQYLQVHQRTRTPKLSLAPRPFSPAACTQLFNIPFITRPPHSLTIKTIPLTNNISTTTITCLH